IAASGRTSEFMLKSVADDSSGSGLFPRWGSRGRAPGLVLVRRHLEDHDSVRVRAVVHGSQHVDLLVDVGHEGIVWIFPGELSRDEADPVLVAVVDRERLPRAGAVDRALVVSRADRLGPRLEETGRLHHLADDRHGFSGAPLTRPLRGLRRGAVLVLVGAGR